MHIHLGTKLLDHVIVAWHCLDSIVRSHPAEIPFALIHDIKLLLVCHAFLKDIFFLLLAIGQ